MNIHAVRLLPGMDLKVEIENYVKTHQIESGVVLSGVGCINHLAMRLADGESVYEVDQNFEIVALQGTLSMDGCHIHIALADEQGLAIGGHLKDGCIINTTVELVLGSFDDHRFHRRMDELTGYDELVVEVK